jgi:DNA invertase Pin-like site-specific DNA recombinase
MNDFRQNAKLTILYQRLSKDDEQQSGESNSILNQRRLLEEYAERNGFTNCVSIAEMITSSLIQCGYALKSAMYI